MSVIRGHTVKEEEEGFSEEDEERSVEEEDFEAVMKAASSAVSRRKLPEQQVISNIPQTVDDFLRNFLRKTGLSRTLRSFEAEWYGSAQRLLQETLPTSSFIPDALTHRHLLQLELDSVRGDADLLRREVLAAAESLVKLQRERDFHRLQYGRVAEQKNQLVHDFRQLQKHLRDYQPALRQLEDKYQTALRQKTLISLQKDQIQDSGRKRPKQGMKCQKLQ